MPDIIFLASRLLNIFADGFRDGPMWAAGLFVIGSWFIIKTYHKCKKDLIDIIRHR